MCNYNTYLTPHNSNVGALIQCASLTNLNYQNVLYYETRQAPAFTLWVLGFLKLLLCRKSVCVCVCTYVHILPPFSYIYVLWYSSKAMSFYSLVTRTSTTCTRVKSTSFRVNSHSALMYVCKFSKAG